MEDNPLENEESLKPIPRRRARQKTNMKELVQRLVEVKLFEEEKKEKIEKIRAAREALKRTPSQNPVKPKIEDNAPNLSKEMSPRNSSGQRASTRGSNHGGSNPTNNQDVTMSPYGEPLPPIDSPDKPPLPRKSVPVPTKKLSPATRPTGVGLSAFISGLDKSVEQGEDWRGGKSLAECNQYMFDNEINCDVTFLIGEEEEAMLAHSYVLMSRSSSFNILLERDVHSMSKLYTFPDVKPAIFMQCLKYIYTDTIEVTDGNASDLISLAHKLNLTTLTQNCFRVMLSRMNPNNACTLLEKAHTYNEKEVFEKCKKFIRANGKAVLAAPTIKDLCRRCLGEIVSSDGLNADEVSVFKALLYWASTVCKDQKLEVTDQNRRQVLDELVYSVRYNFMEVNDFTTHVSPREVLSPDEKIAMFQFFHDKYSNLPSLFDYKKPRNYDAYKDHSEAPEYEGKKNKDSKKLPEPDVTRTETPILSTSRVLRFKKINGSWHSKGPDAITFYTSKPIMLLGLQIYGSIKYTASYTVSITVLNQALTPVLNDSIRIEIEKCGIADVIFADPLKVPQDKQYTVETLIHGDIPTARGINGMETVEKDGVTFNFKESSKSVNGTSVISGQIPGLVFRKME